MMPHSSFKQRGFTLIEILVSGTILFMVLVAVSQSYKASTNNTEKATSALHIFAGVPFITSTIQHYLQQSDPSDVTVMQEGILDGVVFQWRAEIIKSDGAPDQLDVDTGTFISQPERYHLWKVDVTLTYEQRQESFSYEELTWQ